MPVIIALYVIIVLIAAVNLNWILVNILLIAGIIAFILVNSKIE